MSDNLPDFPLDEENPDGGAPGDAEDSGAAQSASMQPTDFSDVSLGIQSAAEEFDTSSKRFAKASDTQSDAISDLASAVTALTASLGGNTNDRPDPAATAPASIRESEAAPPADTGKYKTSESNRQSEIANNAVASIRASGLAKYAVGRAPTEAEMYAGRIGPGRFDNVSAKSSGSAIDSASLKDVAAAIQALDATITDATAAIKSIKSPAAKAPDAALTAGLENPRQADATAAAFPTAVVPGITDASATAQRDDDYWRIPDVSDSPPAHAETPHAESSSTDSSFVSPSLGESGKDSVDAKLKPGEFIMRPEAVKAIGADNLEAANNQLQRPEHHATGGMVGRGSICTPRLFTQREPVRHYATGGAVSNFFSGISAGARAGYAAGKQTREEAPSNIGSSIGAMAGIAAGNPLGTAASLVVESFKSVSNAAAAAAVNLVKYDGNIAASSAMANQRQILGDVSRAESVGAAVGRNVDVTSKMSNSTQDLFASLMRAGLAVVNPILELLEPMYKFMVDVLQHALADLLTAVAEIVDWVDGSGEGPMARDLRQAASDIRKLANKEDENQGGLDIDGFMRAFLEGHGTADDEEGRIGKHISNNFIRRVGPGRRPPRFGVMNGVPVGNLG